jgi:hypothetical protein
MEEIEYRVLAVGGVAGRQVDVGLAAHAGDGRIVLEGDDLTVRDVGAHGAEGGGRFREGADIVGREFDRRAKLARAR